MLSFDPAVRSGLTPAPAALHGKTIHQGYSKEDILRATASYLVGIPLKQHLYHLLHLEGHMVGQAWQLVLPVTSAFQSRVPMAIERIGQAQDFIGNSSNSPSISFTVVDHRAWTR